MITRRRADEKVFSMKTVIVSINSFSILMEILTVEKRHIFGGKQFFQWGSARAPAKARQNLPHWYLSIFIITGNELLPSTAVLLMNTSWSYFVCLMSVERGFCCNTQSQTKLQNNTGYCGKSCQTCPNQYLSIFIIILEISCCRQLQYYSWIPPSPTLYVSCQWRVALVEIISPKLSSKITRRLTRARDNFSPRKNTR